MYKTKLPTDVKERSFLIEEFAELLIKYSRITKREAANVEWSDYKHDLLKVLDKTQPMPMTCVVIMDHPTLQVGRSGRRIQAHARSNSLSIHRTTTIQNFLREHVVAIVHLVRDAKIQNTTTANSFRH